MKAILLRLGFISQTHAWFSGWSKLRDFEKIQINIHLLICIIIILGQISVAQAQGTRSSYDNQALPPSPTVASLGTYGTIPVGYYTGLPEVSIPVHTLTVQGLTIPIGLSYHSAGLVVDERAGNAGLGWSCTGLSVIGQQIMGGKSDFEGYIGQSLRRVPRRNYVVPNDNSLYEYSNEVLSGVTDSEPDVFNYSFPGHAGKFVFDSLGAAHPIPYESLKITYTLAGIGGASNITIVDEAGNRFLFMPGEFSYKTFPVGCGPQGGGKSFTGPTAYFLDRIITAYQDTVHFAYQGVTESYPEPRDLTEYGPAQIRGNGSCNPIYPPRNCFATVSHTTSLLSKITHRQETVEFAYETGRQDLDGGKRLAGITVKYAGVVQKQFMLYHSYFTTPTMGVPLPLGVTPQDLSRLRLDSIRQVGLPAHRFAYHLPPTESFPPVHSYAQDRWGYYNRQSANTTLIVRPDQPSANRDSDSTAALLGMLTRITYPTGGTSTFVYEANRIHQAARELSTSVTLGEVGAESQESNMPGRGEVTFTIAGNPRDMKPVKVYYGFPPPTLVNTGGELNNGSGSTISGGSARVTLTDAATGYLYYSATSGGSATTNATTPFLLSLPAGATYRLTAYAVGGQLNLNPDAIPGDTYYSGSIRVTGAKILPAGNQPVGGCRLKQLTHDGHTPFGPPKTTFYGYDSLGISTGKLLTLPQLTSAMNSTHVEHVGDEVTCTYNVYMQSSVNQLGLTRGCVAVYPQVTTLSGPTVSTLSHKSVYSFSFCPDVDDASNQYPFPPPTSLEWLRGKLLREQHFEYFPTTNSYALVQEKKYTYRANFNLAPGHATTEPPYPNQTIVTGYRIHTISSGQLATSLGSQDIKVNVINPYYYYSASVYLTKTEETLYQNNLSFSTSKLFGYNDTNLLPVRERTSTTLGDTLTKLTSYCLTPPHSSSSTPHATLRALQWEQQQHILNRPLETAWYRYRTGQPLLALKRTLTLRTMTSNMSLPAREYSSEGGAAVTVPIAYFDVNRDSLVYDHTYYPRLLFQRYNELGSPLQRAVPSGRSEVYQYGYQNQLLTAHAVNAKWAQVASTSFEETATGRWHYDSTGTHRVLGGRTGRWAYQVDGTTEVVRGELPAGDYELTYWVNAPNPLAILTQGGKQLGSGAMLTTSAPGSWYQYSTRIHFTATGQVTLRLPPSGGAVRLDEVRLYPMGSQLTTYTHDPLVGLTSITGPDGRTVFYEYDGLGRLLRTRDEQGRILSQQQYHYAGPK